MKKIWVIACLILIAFAIVSCKAKNKVVDVKSQVEERLRAYVAHDLETGSGKVTKVTLSDAPEGSDLTWTAFATYTPDAGDNYDIELLVQHLTATNSITWWYAANYPYGDKTVPLTGDIVFEEPLKYRMEYDVPYEEEMPVQSVSNSKNKQSANNESAVILGKVEQKGSKFTLFDTNKREITHIDMPNRELMGWGNDFFLTKSKDNTFRSYNLRGTEIGSITVSNVESVTFDNEGFILKQKGSSPRKYKKNGQSR